jgi:hypothetical protein
VSHVVAEGGRRADEALRCGGGSEREVGQRFQRSDAGADGGRAWGGV